MSLVVIVHNRNVLVVHDTWVLLLLVILTVEARDEGRLSLVIIHLHAKLVLLDLEGVDHVLGDHSNIHWVVHSPLLLDCLLHLFKHASFWTSFLRCKLASSSACAVGTNRNLKWPMNGFIEILIVVDVTHFLEDVFLEDTLVVHERNAIWLWWFLWFFMEILLIIHQLRQLGNILILSNLHKLVQHFMWCHWLGSKCFETFLLWRVWAKLKSRLRWSLKLFL